MTFFVLLIDTDVCAFVKLSGTDFAKLSFGQSSWLEVVRMLVMFKTFERGTAIKPRTVLVISGVQLRPLILRKRLSYKKASVLTRAINLTLLTHFY